MAAFAEPTDEETVEERTKKWERAQAELKRRLVDEGESAWLQGLNKPPGERGGAAGGSAADTSASGGGWVAGLLDTILGNLVINVSRIHLRLEGDLGVPGAPDSFAAGVTLESLAVHTVDAAGAETFLVNGLADRLRKAATLTPDLVA